MNLSLECKKMKRTGFTPAYLAGGFFAALIPVLNMAVRRENYLGLAASPVRILMEANWQMMAMLNLLLIIAEACIMYHTEYADNAIQKMCTLPFNEYRLFWGKAALMALMCTVILAVEAMGVSFCLNHWFDPSADTWREALKSFGYAWLLMLPAAFGALCIASLCKNMWISLGIGVICVFAATMVPTGNLILSLFPFVLPFRILAGTSKNTACSFMIAAAAEILIIWIAEFLFLKIRRSFK